jgi:flagellar biogenesis protein FliO
MPAFLDIVQPLLALAFVLALLFGLLRLARSRSGAAWPGLRFGGLGWAKPPGLIEILESRPLSPQHVLHLVRVGGRTLLLAVHPAGCVLVESRPSGEAGEDQRRGRNACDPACASS